MYATLLYVGRCTACDGGNIGIRVSSSGQCVAGMCDECDAVWWDPALTDGPHFLAQPRLTCPRDGSSLWERPAHWATHAEAERAGWGAVIQGVSAASRVPTNEGRLNYTLERAIRTRSR